MKNIIMSHIKTTCRGAVFFLFFRISKLWGAVSTFDKEKHFYEVIQR